MDAEVLEKKVDVHSFTPRRFGLPDMQDKGKWLIPRLQDQDKFRHLQATQINTWLRSMAGGTPTALFIHTANAILLAEVVNEAMQPKPLVIERFVVMEGSDNPDPKERKQEDADRLQQVAALYTALKEWAFNLGAAEVQIGEYTDMDDDQLEKLFGKKNIAKRTSLFLKTGK